MTSSADPAKFQSFIETAIPFNEQQLPFSDQHLLDFYEHSLTVAFQQVEELKRIRRLRKVRTWKGSCRCFGSSASSRLISMSVCKSSDIFKKGGGNHGRRPSRMQEKQKAMVHKMVSKITDVCWDKCITGTPGSKFSSSETTCLTNCAQRFLEMSILTVRQFQNMH